MTPAGARALYRREMAKYGESVILRRKGFDDVTVKARAIERGAQVSDVAGSAQQARRVFLVLAEDVDASGFQLPFQAGADRLVWAGRVLPINYADDTQRRIAGELIAYELHVSGK